jgi:2-polyprenyl-3-methyl-5-hydroxy-6-metoxy-1,4-benzoquinol methylase
MNLNSDYYDEEYYEHGKGYHGYRDIGQFDAEALRLFQKYNPKTVLDLGCAKGFLVKSLRDIGVSAFGIDVSEYAISQAEDRVAEYLFVHDFTQEKSVEFPQYDLIVSYDTFEHIPEERLTAVKRFLKDHGTRFYIKVGTVDTPDWQHDASHITIKELDFWKEWFPNADWEISR